MVASHGRAQDLEHAGLVVVHGLGCPVASSGPRIDPVSLALQGRFLTTGHQGKLCFFKSWVGQKFLSGFSARCYRKMQMNFLVNTVFGVDPIEFLFSEVSYYILIYRVISGMCLFVM